MADVFSTAKRSEVMRAVRSKDTKPELAVRRGLFALGYRYRLHVGDLPGKPDVVLPKHRTAIQVRGCFWHSHDCLDGHIPASRQDYWIPKIEGNRKRDAESDELLRASGWKVLIVWECQCAPTRIEATISRLDKALDGKLRA